MGPRTVDRRRRRRHGDRSAPAGADERPGARGFLRGVPRERRGGRMARRKNRRGHDLAGLHELRAAVETMPRAADRFCDYRLPALGTRRRAAAVARIPRRRRPCAGAGQPRIFRLGTAAGAVLVGGRANARQPAAGTSCDADRAGRHGAVFALRHGRRSGGPLPPRRFPRQLRRQRRRTAALHGRGHRRPDDDAADPQLRVAVAGARFSRHGLARGGAPAAGGGAAKRRERGVSRPFGAAPR